MVAFAPTRIGVSCDNKAPRFYCKEITIRAAPTSPIIGRGYSKISGTTLSSGLVLAVERPSCSARNGIQERQGDEKEQHRA